MKKKFMFLLIAILLMPTMVFAREVTLKEFGFDLQNNYEVNLGVTETLDGGYVTAGGSTYSDGYYLVKYNQKDEIQWQILITDETYIYDIDVDSKNNLYVTGYAYQVGNVEYRSSVGVVFKYSADGKLLDTAIIGSGTDSEFVMLNDLELNDDKIVAVGARRVALPKASSIGPDTEEISAYSVVLDLNLDVVKTNQIDYEDNDLFNGVTLTSDGGYVAVGYSRSEDMPGSNAMEYQSLPFIAKYDKNYALEWIEVYPIDSRLNEDNSCFYDTFGDFKGFVDVIEDCDGNYVAVGSVSYLTTMEMPEESASQKINEMLGNHYNNLEIDYESDEYLYYETSAAIIVKYDKSGKKLDEYIENSEYDDSYSDVLLLNNCSLLVTGNIGHQASLRPSSVYSSYEDLGIQTDSCITGSSDVKLIMFDDELNEEWSKLYNGREDEYLYNISPVGENEFAAVGFFTTPQLGSAVLVDDFDALVIRLKMSFEITVEETKNGSAVATNQHGKADVVYHGDVATITTTPDEGYKVDTVKVVDSKGNEVPVEKVENGKYEYHIYDDTWVTVTFKNVEVVEIVQTGVKDFLIVGFVALLVGGIGYYLIDKKSVFKKM